MAETTNTPAEVWRAIPGHEGYEVSSLGAVRSIDRMLSDGRQWRGRVMAQKEAKGGYMAVALSLGSKRLYRHCGVHVLVAEAFLGERPSGAHQVAHGDGDPKNNAVENLRWATAKENAADRERHGNTAHLKGEMHGHAKLTAAAVVEMRRLKGEGVCVDDLAARFNVSRWTAFDALSGRTWGHL